MLADQEFGICLGHDSATLSNWQAPYDIGTIAKIVECKDVDSTSGHLFLNVRGHRKFRITRLIPPALQKTDDYDPFTLEGVKKVEETHYQNGVEKKLYIQAEVERCSPRLTSQYRLQNGRTWLTCGKTKSNKILRTPT